MWCRVQSVTHQVDHVELQCLGLVPSADVHADERVLQVGRDDHLEHAQLARHVTLVVLPRGGHGDRGSAITATMAALIQMIQMMYNKKNTHDKM